MVGAEKEGEDRDEVRGLLSHGGNLGQNKKVSGGMNCIKAYY